MSQTLHPMLNIAIKAARAAGAIINRGSQDLDLLTISHKGPNDFVSEADRAAEDAIIETILTAYPGHGILAEESGRDHGAKHSDYLWIIDPLDGTTNFLHGFPVYCVSIALSFRGKVEQAVVYDPNRNDLFYASKGRGAYLNDKRLRVSKRTRLSDALVGTGFPFRRGDNFQRYLKMFETVMQNCAGLRRPGAAALDLCYVAAGWYDGFFETGLHPWDIAAGSLMVTEAGGLIGNFTGEADYLFQREVVAGSPKVYGQLVTLLAPFSRAISADEAGSEAQPDASSTGQPARPAKAGKGQARQDTSPEAALAAAVASGTKAADDSAEDSANNSAAEPAARVRKPVRIRRADVAAADDPADLGAAAPASPSPALADEALAADADASAGDQAATPGENDPAQDTDSAAPADAADAPAAKPGPKAARQDKPFAHVPVSHKPPEADRDRGARPARPQANKAYGDRPAGDRAPGDRPRGDRPTGGRAYGDRPAGERGPGERDRGGDRGRDAGRPGAGYGGKPAARSGPGGPGGPGRGGPSTGPRGPASGPGNGPRGPAGGPGSGPRGASGSPRGPAAKSRPKPGGGGGRGGSGGGGGFGGGGFGGGGGRGRA